LGRCAVSHFDDVVLLDISEKMLDAVDVPGARKVVGDCNFLPFGDESLAVVGAFATLHHLYDPRRFFAEAWRTLRPGGVLYTDHDITDLFVSRWRWPLRAYRAVFDHWNRYRAAYPELTLDAYRT